MFPFAGSGDTAWHTAPTLGDDWIKKVTDPIIAFKLHSVWACVINVMIIHITPMLPQWIFSHLVLIRWHVTLIIKHRHNSLRRKHFEKSFQENIKSNAIKSKSSDFQSAWSVSFHPPAGHLLVITVKYNGTASAFYNSEVKAHIIN